MMNSYLVGLLISSAMSAYAGWTINQVFNDAEQKHSIEAAAVAQREFHRLEQARSSAALGAQVVARKSEARLRADAAASQSAYIGLQDATSDALRTAALDNAACLAISHTFGELLDTSAARYRELGAKADQHLIDLKIQIDTP